VEHMYLVFFTVNFPFPHYSPDEKFLQPLSLPPIPSPIWRGKLPHYTNKTLRGDNSSL
jgi:hypothetical protein